MTIFSTAAFVDQEEADNNLLADVLMWVFGRSTASGNAIAKVFGVGEKGGIKRIERLHEMGIVSAKDAEKPRNPRVVIPQKIEDLTPDAIAFLEHHGKTRDHITEAFANRN